MAWFRFATGSGDHPVSYLMDTGGPFSREGGSKASTDEVKNVWTYTSTPPYIFMARRLVKHRDNFNFSFASPLVSCHC